MSRTAILVCDRPAPARELALVAEALANDGRLQPLTVGLPSAPGERRSGARLDRLPRMFRGAAEAIVTGVRLALDIRRARALLRERAVAVVLVSDDRAVGIEMAYLAAAERLGIPSVVVPYALSDPASDAIVRRGGRHVLRRHPLRGLVARRWPSQVRRAPGEDSMLFYPAGVTLALAVVGALPRRPWVMGGGRSSVVAVFGDRDRRDLAAWGADPEKLVVTGQASLDDLMVSAAPSRIVCAVPQLAEHGLVTWERHGTLVDELFEVLSSWRGQVMLSLHPKSDPAWYRERASRHGLEIATLPLRDLLGDAMIFVASWSSTVRWAAMLGIPTVIDDRAGLALGLYDDLSGVAVVDTAGSLRDAIAALVEDTATRSHQGEALRRSASDLGVLDGGASRRIAHLAAGLAGVGGQIDPPR